MTIPYIIGNPYLDANFAASGSVTSIATTGTVNGITLTGGPITGTGTITLGGTLDLSSPPDIGGTVAAAGTFTTLSASSTVSGTGFDTYLASPPAIGGSAAAAGSFTTLAASSTVSGTGFSTYLASPPAIGGSAPAAGSFTTLAASGTVSGTGFSTYLASPPAIGGSAAAAGAFTTLTASSTVSGVGFDTYLASPPAIGGSAAAAGTFTTLSASSIAAGSVLAGSGGLSSTTTIGATVTPTTGGVTLALQTLAAGNTWRITAYGTYTAANSATARNAVITLYWGSSSIGSIAVAVLTVAAQTTQWKAEFEIGCSVFTQSWTTGTFLNSVGSATALSLTNATPAATTVSSYLQQTIDLRFSMSNAGPADSWAVQQVTMERLK